MLHEELMLFKKIKPKFSELLFSLKFFFDREETNLSAKEIFTHSNLPSIKNILETNYIQFSIFLHPSACKSALISAMEKISLIPGSLAPFERMLHHCDDAEEQLRLFNDHPSPNREQALCTHHLDMLISDKTPSMFDIASAKDLTSANLKHFAHLHMKKCARHSVAGSQQPQLVTVYQP
jgi:hypothetical protein